MFSQALEARLELSGNTSSNLLDCLKEQVLRLGFHRFQLRLKTSSAAALNHDLVISNYPESWCKTYDALGYAHIDPLLLHCSRNVVPITWSKQLYSSPQQCSLWKLAMAHGLQHGVTFALHGPCGPTGTFGLNIQVPTPEQANTLIRQQLGALSLLRDEVLQAVLPLAMPATTPLHIRLTRREKEVLYWSAFGKTSWEISNICSCSESNVEFHFKNIRRKFGVSSRRAAVARALSMQLIQI